MRLVLREVGQRKQGLHVHIHERAWGFMKALISSVVSSHHRALSSQSIIGHLLYCQLGDSLRRQLLTSPQGRPGPWQISEEQCLFSLSFLASGF